MRKRIYIAGPISKGSLAANVNQATNAFVRLAKAGYAPLCPHWSVYAKTCHPDVQITEHGTIVSGDQCHGHGTKNGNSEMSHDDWIGIDLPWVAAADAVLRLPGESTGADEETAWAEVLNIPVFTSIDTLLAQVQP